MTRLLDVSVISVQCFTKLRVVVIVFSLPKYGCGFGILVAETSFTPTSQQTNSPPKYGC